MFSMLKVCLYGNMFILYMKVFWMFPLHVKFKSKKKKMFSTNIPFIFLFFVFMRAAVFEVKIDPK